MMVDVAALERRADLAAKDAILVGLRASIEAGMKVGGDLLDILDAETPKEKQLQAYLGTVTGHYVPRFPILT